MRNLLLLLLLHSILAGAQTFRCVEYSKASLLSGKPLKSGITLDMSDKIIVKKKGFVDINARALWKLRLAEPGVYSVDSLYALYVKNHAYVDSNYTYLRDKKLLECEYKRNGEAMDNESSYRLGNIVLEGRDINRKDTVESVVDLSYKCNKPYEGVYYLVVYNYFGDPIDIVKTTKPTLKINLAPYKEKTLKLVVYRDDCVRSAEYTFVVKLYQPPIKKD